MDADHQGRGSPNAENGWNTAEWQYDSNLKTEIEVRFIPEGKNATRVEFEYRRLDRYGARRDEMRDVFDTKGDWGKFLAAFVQVAERSPHETTED